MKLPSAVLRAFEKPSGLLGFLAGRIMAGRGSNVERNRWGVSLLALEPHHRVLEFGCGPGLALDFILPAAGFVVALDHSAQMIRMTQERHAGAAREGKLQLQIADVFEFARAYSGDGFDRIFSSNVVQFWPDLEAGFRALKPLLRPSGSIVTNFMSRGNDPSSEKTRATAEAIARAQQEAGFSSVQIETLELKPIAAASIVARTAPLPFPLAKSQDGGSVGRS